MATEIFWKTAGGAPGPWGYFDKDAILRFEFNAAQWVADSGTDLTMVSATVLANDALTIDQVSFTPEGVVLMRIQKTDKATRLARFTPFTIRMVLSDTQQDDRTFYLAPRPSE